MEGSESVAVPYCCSGFVLYSDTLLQPPTLETHISSFPNPTRRKYLTITVCSIRPNRSRLHDSPGRYGFPVAFPPDVNGCRRQHRTARTHSYAEQKERRRAPAAPVAARSGSGDAAKGIAVASGNVEHPSSAHTWKVGVRLYTSYRSLLCCLAWELFMGLSKKIDSSHEFNRSEIQRSTPSSTDSSRRVVLFKI